MKRSRLILSFFCASSITGFSMAPAMAEQQFSGNNVPRENPFLPLQITRNKPADVHKDVLSAAYFITSNTVLPTNGFEGIDFVKISGDLLSVNSPVTESGASTNPAIAAENNSSTAMADYGESKAGGPCKNQSPIIPVRLIASPSELVIRVVK